VLCERLPLVSNAFNVEVNDDVLEYKMKGGDINRKFLDALKGFYDVCCMAEAFEVIFIQMNANASIKMNANASIKINAPQNLIDFSKTRAACKVVGDPLVPLVDELWFHLLILVKNKHLWSEVKFV